ncbi:MAG: protein kinase domain-containing protein [Aquabacterium sp.]
MSNLAHDAKAQRIGRFILREPLGKGAQATVWRAHDERLDRDVALKLLDQGGGAEALAEWLNEARAVSRLSHPNIVPVFEADSQAGQPYMVFELVMGRTLSDALRKDGAMAPRAAVAMMMQVLQALAAAHAQGIVHRDLKPSNILIDETGRPRVMDFGIAARVTDGNDGRIVGTPGYISPEAAAGAQPVPAMDVFSAGMVLAHMLAGRALIQERDPMMALQRARKEVFRLPTNIVCDDALRAVANRALERDLALRYPSAQAMQDALAATAPPDARPEAAESSSATLDFLLRRMRHKSDFPTMSDSIVRIQRMATSDTESLASLSAEILKDVALTHKLLRLVNTAGYSHAGGGSISTISRAVALIGFAGIRNMALSLVLLEHMQDKAHASRLREEFAGALMAGQLANELTPWARDAEEVYVAALLGNLGRLLTEFYFPEEARSIREALSALPAPAGSEAVEAASVRVLGLSFQDLGIGVARAWGLPEPLRQAMRRPEGEPPNRAAERGAERHRWLAALANDMSAAMMQLEPLAAQQRLAELAERHARLMGLPVAAFAQAVATARQKLSQMAPALGLRLEAGSPARRLLDDPSPAVPGPTDSLSPHQLQATLALPRGRPDVDLAVGVSPSEDAPTLVASPQPGAAADLLTAGIQDVTHALASESFRLNEALRMIMETLLRALRLRRVIFLLRDARKSQLVGRFGLGDQAQALASRYTVALQLPAGNAPDLFTAVCLKGADTLIADAGEPRIRDRMPTWFADVPATSFLLLPLHLKGAPFALIYADASSRIEMDERELALVRTLRNQALMAFRQGG